MAGRRDTGPSAATALAVPVPSLDDLATHPERAQTLPLEARQTLVLRCAAALAALATAPARPSGPLPSPAEAERYLSAEVAATLLGVTPRWLYRHARQLPFARRLSRRCLRFSEPGLRRWMAAASAGQSRNASYGASQ